jgi:translation initiation factor IF-3
MPEMLWKSYIDFEVQQAHEQDEGEGSLSLSSSLDRARRLYDRLLERSNQHVKVWISYGKFEFEQSKAYHVSRQDQKGERELLDDNVSSSIAQARGIFSRG